MTRTSLALASILAALALPAAARDKPLVALVEVESVRPGLEGAYEDGRRDHLAWHRKQNDAWSWDVWQVVTGPRSGAYVVGTFGHHWEDFDARASVGAEDAADAASRLASLLDASEESYWILREDLSRPGDAAKPAAMVEVVRFQVRPEARADFVEALRKIRTALDRFAWAGSFAWYELASGGELPCFVETIPHDTWASMERPEPSLEAALEKIYGRQEAQALLKRVVEDALSRSSAMLRYRPDLSYAPDEK